MEGFRKRHRGSPILDGATAASGRAVEGSVAGVCSVHAGRGESWTVIGLHAGSSEAARPATGVSPVSGAPGCALRTGTRCPGRERRGPLPGRCAHSHPWRAG